MHQLTAMLFAGALLAGCGSIEIGSVYKTSATPSAHLVPTYFATDRAPGEIEPPTRDGGSYLVKSYGGERGKLSLGVAYVSIPLTHKMGEVERPRWYRFEFREDAGKHVVVRQLVAFTKQSDFFMSFNRDALAKGTLQSFIFVHGYNVSFDDAARRTAQISFDMGLTLAPVFYSWPSQGAMKNYTVDEANAEWTEANLRDFLEKFADEASGQSIYVIAHSMGARPATRALVSLLERRSDLRARFKEVVLAAPDLDGDVFQRDIAPKLVEATSLTLYVSSRDKALQASRVVHGNHRAGDVADRPVVLHGMDTIDASTIDTDFLAHSYVADTRPLLTDLSLLIGSRFRAVQRPGLSRIGIGEQSYFAFRR